MFVAWYLTGEEIFTRGHAAVGCYVFCLVAIIFGGLAAQLAHQAEAVKLKEQGSDLRGVASLTARVDALERQTKARDEAIEASVAELNKKISTVSIAAGIRPRVNQPQAQS